jgi:16S rRNA (uracil1498-N3)-methyltransferase
MEATKQCERARVMPIDEPLAFEEFLKRVEPSSRDLMMFSEKGGGGIPSSIADKKITALVGPKGGWEDSEIESAERTGFVTIKLGSRIMRAETAAITFAALLQHRFGDLG